MQKLTITFANLSEDDRISLTEIDNKHCIINHTNGADGVITDIFTIFADNPIFCGIVANILTEIVKRIASDTWDTIKISVKLPNGAKFINLGRNKFCQLMNKQFGTKL